MHMANRFQKKRETEKQIAVEHIQELFHQADAALQKHPDRAHKYIALAWKISTRSKTSIPIPLKRQFCRKCLHYLKPGITGRIRLSKGKKIYYCMNCGSIRRVPYKARK